MYNNHNIGKYEIIDRNCLPLDHYNAKLQMYFIAKFSGFAVALDTINE